MQNAMHKMQIIMLCCLLCQSYVIWKDKPYASSKYVKDYQLHSAI